MKLINEYRYYIICCLLVFIHTGINSVATALMPQLKLYYNVQLSEIITGAAACSLTMFIGGFIGAKFIKKVKPKGAFAIASICAALYAMFILITNKLWGFYLGCALVGFTACWGNYATSIIYINKYYEKKSAILISSLITVGFFGSAFFQFCCGYFLPYIGLKGIYLSLILIALLALLLNYLFLSNIDAVEKNDEIKSAVDISFYKSKTFIKMSIVTLFGGTLCATFGTLFTTFFQSHGISTTLSTTYLSFYTLSCGLLALIGGMVVDKFGYKIYVIYLFAAYVIAISSALIFDNLELMPIIPFMILFFGLASSIGSIYNLLSKPIFKEKSLTANTKLLSIGSFGSAILLPTYTKLYEYLGFTKLWIILFIVSIICFALLISVINEKKI